MDANPESIPTGFSDLFPFLPLLSFASFICCMLILPGFIKTRVFALSFLTAWLALGNLLLCINMCIWRNNTRNIPIYSDFVAHIWAMYTTTLYAGFTCFHKFVWNITKLGSSLQVCDKRKSYNHLDILMTIIFPLLWTSVHIFMLRARYNIIEDIGPLYALRMSLGTILIRCVPLTFLTIASVCFNVLTLVNVWRAQNLKQAEGVIDPSLSQFYRTLSPEQVIRYWAMALISSSAFVFGCCWAWRPVVINLKDDKPWYTISGLHIDTKQLRIIERTARHEIGPATLTGFKGFFVSIPATGIIIFLLFGLGPEALSRYSSWLQSLSSFFKLSVSLCFSKKPTSRLPSWVNRHATSPIDPENFTPFHANDIAVDPTPFPYPPNIMNQPTHTLFTQSTIQPAHHPATLRGLRLDMGSNSQGMTPENWRTYHKPPLLSSPTDGRWRIYQKEPFPSWGVRPSATSPPRYRSHFDVVTPSSATSSNSGWHFSATNDSSWYLPTGSSPREEEMPPAYQPSASRNTALKDPLSPIV